MAAHATTMTMTIHAIVLMVSPAKIVPTTLIGVHKTHAKMVPHVHNVKIHSNVIVLLDGLVNYVTLKWCRAQMRLSAKASIQNISVITAHARISVIHIDAIANKDILDRIVKRRSTNVKVAVSITLSTV